MKMNAEVFTQNVDYKPTNAVYPNAVGLARLIQQAYAWGKEAGGPLPIECLMVALRGRVDEQKHNPAKCLQDFSDRFGMSLLPVV